MLPPAVTGAAIVAPEIAREAHLLRPKIVEDVPRAAVVGSHVPAAACAGGVASARWIKSAVRGFSKGTSCSPGAVEV